jgi:hypothetical protein
LQKANEVPSLIDDRDELMVIEMDLMQAPPYIIDFAKVRFDRPPDFSPETIADHEAQCWEWFVDQQNCRREFRLRLGKSRPGQSPGLIRF